MVDVRKLTREQQRTATAQRILEAAQIEFGEHGSEGTTVRAIAKRAGVDASLVIHHYGSKDDLFAMAAQLHGGSADDEIAAHLYDVLDVHLSGLPPATRALVRSMLTAPTATAAMREFLNERVANLARAMGGVDADLRAALTVSSLLGLTLTRHFFALDALAAVSDAQVEQVLQPWLTTGVNQSATPTA